MATQNLSERPFLTVKQVAEALSVNRNTVYGWIKKGKLASMALPGGRSYRVSRDSLEEFVAELSQEQLEARPLRSRGGYRDFYALGQQRAAAS